VSVLRAEKLPGVHEKKEKIKMTTDINFQKKHSRNQHDWAYKMVDGRHSLVATNKGVKRRCGLIVVALSKVKEATPIDLLDSLSKNNPSYNIHDVRNALIRLVDGGIVSKEEFASIYKLTKKGQVLWMSANKSFKLEEAYAYTSIHGFCH